MRGVTQLWIAAVLVGSFASSAFGATIRHDRDLEQYVDYGDGIRLVGGVNNALTSFGSGVVIHPEWVLTAAHVVSPISDFGISFETDPDPDEVIPPPPFDFPVSGFFFVTEVAIHEFYDDALGPAGGFDIALLRLDRPVTQFTPWNILRANPATNPELEHVGTSVGFGALGTGLTGFDETTAGFLRVASDNMIDAVATHPLIIDEFVERTVVDPNTGQTLHFTREQIASQFILSDFDSPESAGDFANLLGSADPLDLEGSVAPGDSGGPLLIDFGNGWVVSGINSFIHAPEPPDGDGIDDASYSDLAGYLRVSMFSAWIDQVIGIPEPTGAALLLLLAGAVMMRRRTRG